MENIEVEIIEYINEKPFPGIVKCKFNDIFGKEWNFIDKTTIFTNENITQETKLPLTGCLSGEIIEIENDVICFCTKNPYSVESTDGETKFYVYENQIIKQ